MKASTENKRIETKASHTALMAAIYRFLATKEKKQGFKGPDKLAYLFLPSKARFFLSFDLFIQAVKENIPQIVFLGAGYDTRSIRFHEILNGTEIFELDVPSTQNQKLDVLRKNKMFLPENLHYVPIDFDREDLKQILFRAGYDPTRRSLFIWEGICLSCPCS